MNPRRRFRKPLLAQFRVLRLPLQVLGFCLSFASYAPSEAFEAGLRPLGIELGSAIQDVRSHIREVGATCDEGTSAVARGPLLNCTGAFGLEGLQQVKFLFSRGGRLEGVVLTLPKERWRSVNTALAERYRLERSLEPFVGDRSSTYIGAGGRVDAESPHLSFEMSLTYATDWLLEAADEHSAVKESEARRKDAASL